MGLLIDGEWKDQWYDTKSTGGRFVRKSSQFRDRVTADGSSGFKAESGRYHLYVSYACPWAHRTLIYRKLKGLEDHISVSVVNPLMLEHGWTFDAADGVIPDPIVGAHYLHEIYTAAKPDYSGRVTVPVLWDKETGNHRQQRVVGDHPLLRPRVRRGRRLGAPILPTRARIRHRRRQRIRLRHHQQRGLQERICHHPGGLRGGGRGALFRPRPDRPPALRQQVPCWRDPDRGRLAALHDPPSIRPGLCRPLQVQHPPSRRLPEPVGLHPRALPGARGCRDRPHGPHQGALLPEPRHNQPERRGAGWPRNRLHRSARP